MKPAAIIDCDPGHDDVMAILLAGPDAGPARDHDRPRQRVAREHDDERAQDGRVRRPDRHPDRGRDAAAARPRAALRARRPRRERPRRPDHPAADRRRSSTSTPSTSSSSARTRARTSTSSRSGRSTNIAAALIKDPTLPARIAGITLMGGSLTFGNVTPAAEFNIWCDPEAAHVVFTSGIPIRMIGLNVTRQVLATPGSPGRDPGDGPACRTTHVADMLDHYSARRGRVLRAGRRGDARPASRSPRSPTPDILDVRADARRRSS